DTAHWTAWQAFRAQSDFWGNGLRGSGRPFYANAIETCEAAIPDAMRPIRYDVPGGNVAEFGERSPGALAALDRWEPIATPRSPKSASASAGGVRIDVSLQPRAAENNPLRFPIGVATLALLSPNHSVAGAFDTAGQQHTHAVALPVKEATPVT